MLIFKLDYVSMVRMFASTKNKRKNLSISHLLYGEPHTTKFFGGWVTVATSVGRSTLLCPFTTLLLIISNQSSHLYGDIVWIEAWSILTCGGFFVYSVQ